MISRRRILSRSRDDLHLDSGVGFPAQVEEEEDVWYNKDKLYKVRSVFSCCKDALVLVSVRIRFFKNTIKSNTKIHRKNTRYRRCVLRFIRVNLKSVKGHSETSEDFVLYKTVTHV